MNRLRKQSHERSDSTPATRNTINAGAVATRPPLQIGATSQPVISQTLRAALGLPLSSSGQDAAVQSSAATTSYYKSSASAAVQPRTRVEQYWAARAFAAETTLLGYEHGEKRRAKDQELHDARHAKLERMVYALLTLLALVILGLLVLSLSHSRSHKKDAPGRHFTIPILSPFTSVIEHETSVIGSTTLAVFGLAAAALGYAMFRHWVGRPR